MDNWGQLRDWDEDDDFNEKEEGEAWKPNPTREACKALYRQWQQVMLSLTAALETVQTPAASDDPTAFPPEYWAELSQSLLGDGFEVAAKMKGSEAAGIYILRMENAAIIRKNAQGIESSMLLFMHEGIMTESYVQVIRSEIKAFRQLFRHWVATFEKDEFEDEWGLF